LIRESISKCLSENACSVRYTAHFSLTFFAVGAEELLGDFVGGDVMGGGLEGGAVGDFVGEPCEHQNGNE
jgi:hypothetical protein